MDASRTGGLLTAQEAVKLAGSASRVAVLGIKPEDKADQPAHFVPAYLQATGVEVIPVPTYYPDVTTILGQKVYKRLQDIPGPPVDVVDVFRRPADIPGHLEDLLAAKPRAVWLQSGIRCPEVEAALIERGIQVVADRCLKVDRAAALSSRL